MTFFDSLPDPECKDCKYCHCLFFRDLRFAAAVAFWFFNSVVFLQEIPDVGVFVVDLPADSAVRKFPGTTVTI